MSTNALLHVQGNHLVDGNGATVTLRGFGLGGWLNMENFVTGYPANEEAHRNSVRRVLGPDNYELFFERFLDYFFTEADAKFISSLGLNLLRIPVNYRHLEDDMRPFEIKQEGFRHLDRVIDLCARYGIYTIIDLHALPGYQNQHWHSDNPTHTALLWQHKHFQDRTVHLWEAIAARYRGNGWVAGYNPVNEPADPSQEMIMPLYRRLYDAIRAVDPDHVLFLEGNRYSQDFHMFGEPWQNVVYTNHDYALPGFVDGGPYPGTSRGKYVDRDVLEQTFLDRSSYMMEHGLHVWVGEFGPVYTGDPAADEVKYQVLRDQLEIYDKYGASWAIWLYKDIGLQGVAYTDPHSPWMQRVGPAVEKKDRLGADSWGSTEEGIAQVMAPVRDLFDREFPRYDPFPFGPNRQIQQLVRHILLAEPLVEEFAELLSGLTPQDIDTMMRSFLLENCRVRGPLAELLSQHSGQSRQTAQPR